MTDRDYDVQMFLDGIETLCRKYNLSISHEDEHGSFIIEDYNELNIDWLNDAWVGAEGVSYRGTYKWREQIEKGDNYD